MKMRVTAIACIVFLAFLMTVQSAAAQDHPKTELFVGFSILAAEDGDYEAFYGLQPNVAFNFHENVGIVMDFGFQSRTLREPMMHSTSFTIYEYMVGPRFSMRLDKATVFAHTLFGGMTGESDFGSETGFGMGFGGGIDINAGDRFAIRAAQFDWMPNRMRGRWSTREIRLGFGVVIKFGS